MSRLRADSFAASALDQAGVLEDAGEEAGFAGLRFLISFRKAFKSLEIVECAERGLFSTASSSQTEGDWHFPK